MPEPGQGLTRALAAFIAGIEPTQLSRAAVETVTRGLADCVGVMFAGRDEPAARLASGMVDVAQVPGGQRRSRVLGDRGFASAPDAAFVNAVAAHALDYDDTGLDGHPSVVLVPLILAHGEASGASGADALAAYVAGYETWAELIARDEDKHHGKGWHPTAVFGVVAAAAAGARLARLDARGAAHALGIAASMAGGVVANFGSMTKPLQVGFAARNGLLAVELAARGATAAPDALEHARGFLAALSPAGRVRLDGPMHAGDPWQIERQGLNVKRYPVCYAVHRAVDAAIELHESVKDRLDGIDEVVVEIGQLQADMLRSARPDNVLDARFSAQFAMASALQRGRLGLSELTGAYVNSASIQAMIGKVRISAIDEHDPADPLFSPFDRVSVRFAGGEQRRSAPVRHARGHALRPIDLQALRVKFMDCAGPAIGEAAAGDWWRALMAFESGGPASLNPP